MNEMQELSLCPVEITLTLISNRRKVLILRDLMIGTKRFGELKKSIGHVTQKVLTANLRDMEGKGLLTRKGLCGGAAQCKMHTHRPGPQPETRFGRHAGVGRGIPGAVIWK